MGHATHTPGRAPLRDRLREIIFEADTRAGKAYDVALILTISLSVLGVMLDSVRSIREAHGSTLVLVEWGFTLLLTADYAVRLWCSHKPLRYALSFFGIVDFLGVVPTYVSLVSRSSRYLVAIRFLRVLRTFRVLKLSSYMGESLALLRALRASVRRITVFLLFVITLVVVIGSLMYVIEGEKTGFTSIPTSIYWAVVTLTTVGYGDISPGTPLGQALAAVLMILGYSIIVVPTGIVSVEVTQASMRTRDEKACPACDVAGHEPDAAYCNRCGAKL